jgi:hypothetical protein
MEVEKRNNHDRGRFERFNIVVPILLAGWVPSILTLFVSYTILSKTLESKILRDRQAFVQLIGHMVGDDLSRTGGIIEYYQTLPEASRIVTGPNAQTNAQQLLASAFYSHPRIDGMFVTDPNGQLIASLPSDPTLVGKDFESAFWRDEAAQANQAYVSAVHPRISDKRMATDVVGAIRGADGKIVGYLGVSVLVERIGRRLSTIQLADQAVCQVLDQNGTALFTNNFRPNPRALAPMEENLLKDIGRSQSGHIERRGTIYSFSPVESTKWVALIQQPKAIAYKPVHDLVRSMTLLTMCLMGGTTVFAILFARLYRRQTESARRLEREVIFNEKILANMPTGIAFVDPASRRFLQANESFAQMARRFVGLVADR